jgi:hypothetical protein
MTARRPRSKPDQIAALRADPLAEILRRLVPIHASVEETTDDDRGIRCWSAAKLMELINNVQAASSDATAGTGAGNSR